MNETHDVELKSWVESANDPAGDFPIQNLPFGVFSAGQTPPQAGVAIGDQILDLGGLLADGPLEGPAREACEAAFYDLRAFMAMGPAAGSALRLALSRMLRSDASRNVREAVGRHLAPISAVTMHAPHIGDYTDFYASIHHATNVGRMMRPDNPLLPNYKYVPIGYHGRTSSIVLSGTAVKRPRGQRKPEGAGEPVYEPTQSLDYELEVGFYVGPGNPQGSPIPINEAASHLFGVCLLNDWSARDIQAWEYQPLGPFLAKNFATTISPWIVTMEALEPYRVPAFARPAGDPAPLPHLRSSDDAALGGIDLSLQALLSSDEMRMKEMAPIVICESRLRDLYWTPAQLLAHHASNGCNLRPADLLGSGTVSGDAKESLGCLLERTRRGAEPIALPTGETRGFLEDGDEVILRGYASKPGFARIGLGECRGVIESG